MPLVTTAKDREKMREYYTRNRERILVQKKARYRTAEGKAAKQRASAKWYRKNRTTVNRKKKLRRCGINPKNLAD